MVEGHGEYTTGRGPTPFRWSLTAGPAEPATVAAFCTPCAPRAADLT